MPASFFCKTTATSVWKSVTGVSSAGMRRGRGKGTGKIIAKDFNRGQQLGTGRTKLVLPGLNTSVRQANVANDLQDLGPNKEFEENLQKARKEMNTFRKIRDHPLDRGWSGRRAHGRVAGQPDPYNETELHGFDSIVLMLRPIQTMSGLLGRVKKMQALVVTGNKNGLAGFDTAIGKDARAVVRHARNRAAQSLVYIPRWDNHTVMHDFFSRYYSTTVFVQRKPKGYGINAHRVIKAICQMFGITDIDAQVEGVTKNQINITKAFFLGLMNQKRYEDIANEKQLHLVDLREENFNYPYILASPEGRVRTDEEIKNSGENLDFTYYINNGILKQTKPVRKKYYVDGPGWQVHLDRQDYVKNRERTKLLLAAKYGDTKVLDVFPYFRTTAASFNKAQEES